jgi:L-rhamnose mutarotase
MSTPDEGVAPVIRMALVMAVNPGRAEDYLSRHNRICPELTGALKEHGVHNYSIYYHPSTRQLFGCVEVEDEVQLAAIAKTEVCRRWWKYMSDIMPVRDGGNPVTVTLTEMFHLE